MTDPRTLPVRPDLRHLRDEAKARRRAGEFDTLARAQLAIAREHGFASWPRLKFHVEAVTLDATQRAERLVRSACSSDPRPAQALLALDPALARHDLACACVCGEAPAVTRRLAADEGRAARTAGPLGWEPILYVCFSRLGRRHAARAAGLRAVAATLLAAGADPDARFINDDGWIQSTLYGAAGIAGDPVLTAALLAAGADPDDDDAEHEVGEALYHACEQADPECARLLIAAGTKQRVVDHCLSRALDFPRVAMVRVFCEGGARPRARHLARAVSARRGAETVALLLDAGARVDGGKRAAHTPLALAVRSGQDEVAALLLDRGADPARVTDEDRALGAYLSGSAGAPSGLPAAELDALLTDAVALGDAAAVGRLLDAGAAVDGGDEGEMGPLQIAAWHGEAAVVAQLVAHGAALTFADGGSAVGAALHGSRHCGDREGGPTMATIEEIDPERYRTTLRVLLDAGAPVPERVGDDTPSGSPGGPRAATLLAELGL